MSLLLNAASPTPSNTGSLRSFQRDTERGTKILRYFDGVGLATQNLSGRLGKVVASHAAVARSIPAEVALIYTMHEAFRGYCP